MKRIVTIGLGVAFAAALAASASFAVSAEKSEMRDPSAACAEMMQASGTTEEGKQAMSDFMRSERAPQAMANMMEMARRMGNGDVMLGMTRMMEMMGGQGGMMGGAMPRPSK